MKNAKNVLFIMVDDLRPELSGGYDHSEVKTPNLDAFAKESLVFEQAHCQIAVCGPSRSSFMSGRRPDSTTVYNFFRHFRQADVGQNWTSLPQHFKNNGYLTLGSGKLYHPNQPPMYDSPLSWSEENGDLFENDDSWPDNYGHGPGGGEDLGKENCGEVQPDELNDLCSPIAWCAVNNTEAENTLGEAINVEVATSRLRGELKAAPDGEAQQPFFLAIGLHKPHLPWSVPERFFDMYPEAEDIPLAANKYPPEGMPDVAFNPTGNCTADTPMPDEYARKARRAYMAAVSYMDSFVGSILEALEDSGRASDTLVVFASDHGWQLGEHGEWQKMTNFDLATRVPLIVRAPWKENAVGRSDALVELVGLFPSMAELAGIPTVADEHPLEGESFAPAFDDSEWQGQGWALSQYPRAPKTTAAKQNDDKSLSADPVNDNITVMGYSLRVEGWRYTEWASFDGTANGGKGKVDWTAPLYGVELYDHSDAVGDINDLDAHENVNVAESPENKGIVAELSKQLREIVADSVRSK
ncbi:hypothetical protein TL16_g05649 [Triparma laevis f. inornata]|uniref:Sulfatase N-terminal domain-containing protein n=1 Tax=Triparma laevis f. inornata TaxID=1714386 RepID=A0A9W7ECP0_9STRA|nr:hypothetical protein TL16_g05649 [Triparma laevis f. inornata]